MSRGRDVRRASVDAPQTLTQQKGEGRYRAGKKMRNEKPKIITGESKRKGEEGAVRERER
jgi:hypothetical protein